MCLITKQIAPALCRKQITVYKVVCDRGEKYPIQRYLSPFMKTEVRLGKPLVAEWWIPHDKHNKIQKQTDGTYAVRGGFIHCTTSLYEAMCMAAQLTAENAFLSDHGAILKVEYRVLQARIEPGTLYYKSAVNHEIAAKWIITEDIIM